MQTIIKVLNIQNIYIDLDNYKIQAISIKFQNTVIAHSSLTIMVLEIIGKPLKPSRIP